MNQSLTLFRLQQIDTQVDRAWARLDNVKKILDDDAYIKHAIEVAETCADNLHSAELLQKKAEIEVQDLKIKIEQIESSLYSGNIHNPKELQDLQKDVISMKKYLITLEDRLLEAMVAVEEAEKENKAAQESLLIKKSDWALQNKNLTQEQSDLVKEIQKLSTERLAVTETLSPDHSYLYETLRQQRKGVAVTGVIDNTCGACGTTLTLAQVQAARSPGQLSRCPSCNRILYAS